MARSVDGGIQFFSRANDFGYSKNPAEALRTWGRDTTLSDVIWAIRKLRSDIIHNRFSYDTASRTHGHHPAPAILSTEAFSLVGAPPVFPAIDRPGLVSAQIVYVVVVIWGRGIP